MDTPDHRHAADGAHIGRQHNDGLGGPLAGGTDAGGARGRIGDNGGQIERLGDLAGRCRDGVGGGGLRLGLGGADDAAIVGIALNGHGHLVHGGDGFDRILAGGRLGREHDGVGAFEDGDRHVRDFGAGRDGSRDHRFQHLGGHDHRLAVAAGHADHALLQARNGFERQLDAEVAAGHHDGIAQLDDLFETLDGLGLFDLGHDASATLDDLAHVDDVFGALHEAEGDPVGLGLEAFEQIGMVLFGEGAGGQQRIGQGHALLVAQLAAIDDLGLDGAIAHLGGLEGQLAVIEQQAVADRHAFDDLGVRQVDTLGIAVVVLVAVEDELLAGDQVDRAIGELPHAQLGALQVDEDAQGMVEALLDIADARHRLVQELMAGMAHIDAEHVSAGLGQFLDHLLFVAGWPEGGDDLCASHASHCVSVSQFEMSSWGASASAGSTRKG